jgi:hypothetical protein
MLHATEELINRSKDCRELRLLRDFHKRHPEGVGFSRAENKASARFQAVSLLLQEFVEIRQMANSKKRRANFKMNDNLNSYYGRAITILHLEFNGHAEFRSQYNSQVDAVFGTRIEPVPKKRPKRYARRLQWADGRSIEQGWRPSTPHEPKPVSGRPTIHLCANCREGCA